MFSVAPFNSRGRANDYVSQFDMAAPGTLPVLNFNTVMLGLKAGILLNCTIPATNRFERKHYFYADMPAGYQITQQRHPVAHSGYFDVYIHSKQNYKKRIGISRIQLEIDSGKTLHDLNNNRSLIDLNRAGVGLLEIVTEPDFSSALESQCFAEQILMVLSENMITEGKMHEGQFRVDANVSLAPHDSHDLGVRTEIKNLNSLQMVYNAVSCELFRHFEILSHNGVVINETRTVDEQGRTLPMRDKEVVTDYRFMPEPNLPTVFIKSEWIDNVKKTINWKPDYLLFITEYEMKLHEAFRIARNRKLSAFMKTFLQTSNLPTDIVLLWLDELAFICNKHRINYPPVEPCFLPFFISIIHYCCKKRITKFTAISLIGQFLDGAISADVEKEINERQIWKINDKDEIDKFVITVLQNNKSTVEKVLKAPKRKLLVKLRNELIQSCGKRIDVVDADIFIDDALKKLKSHIN